VRDDSHPLMSLGAFGNANTQATSSEVAKRRETSEIQWILGDVLCCLHRDPRFTELFSSLEIQPDQKLTRQADIPLVFGVSWC